MESPARDAGRGSTLDLSGNFVVWNWVRKHRGFRGLMGTGCGQTLEVLYSVSLLIHLEGDSGIPRDGCHPWCRARGCCRLVPA